jgi:uncharacterized protein YjbI with pentapeptide repeats
MPDFTNEDLRGARFRDVDLRSADLRRVDLRGVTIRGAWMVDVELSGIVENVRVNGVDVAQLVEAELNRRYPEREKMRPTSADGFREAWQVLERLWDQTVRRAKGIPENLLHERVHDEWSFIETLRHLVFATDAWVSRALLRDPSPWHPLDLPHDEMPDIPGIPRDLKVRPTLDDVQAVRADRMSVVREVLADLTDERLAEMTSPVPEPGYPAPESFPVQRCLLAIISEEWEHRLYAERDLDVLESRG